MLLGRVATLPHGARPDSELLFALAEAHRRDGSLAEATEFYSRLVREHPESELAGAAYIALAEPLYSGGRYAEARAFYEHAVQSDDAGAAAFAEYMRAWTRVLDEPPDYVQGLRGFQIASKRARAGVAAPFDGFSPQRLREAIVVDMVAAYYHVGRPQLFIDFAESLLDRCSDDFGIVLDATLSLGEAYEEAAMRDESDSLCDAAHPRWGAAPCAWQ